jgi:predicted ATP-grasp superfamily ATP-dependent carboligase
MSSYKVLNKQVFSSGNFSIIPIRMEDRFDIMKWRNEQIYHLRQDKPLTAEDQEYYFSNVIASLFEQAKPNQILFSFLENEKCIGYGGLVHINWIDKNAEISFIMDTSLENERFDEIWNEYLSLIERVSFSELELNKINTYSYEFRSNLFKTLELNNYRLEAVLKNQIIFHGKYLNVLIHSKFNKKNNLIEKNFGNILITSLSKKTTLIEVVKCAASRISTSIKVIGGDSDKNSIGRYFVDDFWIISKDSSLDIENFISECLKRKIKMIIPTRDGELEFFSINKNIFQSNGINVMISNFESIKKCFDKLLFSNENGDFKEYFISTFDNINNCSFKSYVVKERYGAGSKSIGINLSKQDAIRHSKLMYSPIFQEFIEGIEISVDAYVDSKNNVKGIILRKRELVINGESQITSTFENFEIEKQFIKIIKSLNLYGHVILQAIIDENSRLRIIECNARFGGASTLSVKAGLDSFYWFILESNNINIHDAKFIKYPVPLKQIRYIKDLYL